MSVYKVTVGNAGAIALNESDYAASVLQNVAVLFATRQGTCPLARSFGLPQKFLDKPVNIAKTLIVNEVREALADWEPRAEYVGIEFYADEDEPGRLIPVVEVSINEQSG